jgi:hypothetical protein
MGLLTSDVGVESPSRTIQQAIGWLAVMEVMDSRERRVFTKIIMLAKNKNNRPVHIIMAMAKASKFANISVMAHAVVEYRLQLAIAKFWSNGEKLREAEIKFKGFLVACDVFTQPVTLADAERKRRLTVVAPSPACQQYQGKSVPFRFATPLRNSVAAFKKAR